MNRRWGLWFAGIFVIALLALLPIRLAIAGIADAGFTARQAAGTIWYGRIGELMVKGRRLGTFEAAVDPFSLVAGTARIRFNRMDDPQGILTGTLLSGTADGVEGLNGRIGGNGLFGSIPLEAIDAKDLDVRFKGGRCAKAGGRLKAILATPIPGLGSTELAGSPRCEGERVRFNLTAPSGQGGLEFYVTAQGRYRAWLRIAGVAPDTGAALAAAGFRQGAEGLVMSAEGRW